MIGGFLGRYRDRVEIVRDILLAVSAYKVAKKTHITYSTKLGYKVFMRYLDEVLKAGLLEYDGKSEYWLTDKGESFLRAYEDYDRNWNSLGKQIGNLENEKKALSKMLSS
jgi:predicted transcriptional regulator